MCYNVINRLKILLLLFVVSASAKQESTGSSRTRNDRAFSLFTVVTFPNQQCVVGSDNTMRGSCLTTTECKDRGGSADGNCASGFGVCCKFITEGCEELTVAKNCTYIQSPGYNAAFTEVSTTCTFNFMSITSDICQLRYDFDDVVIHPPDDVDGECSTDKLQVTSPTGRNPPYLCGTLSGSHMYIEVGTLSDAGNIKLSFGATALDRRFKIKVTQIECTNLSRAPTDCTLYHTGVQGQIESYNYPRILRNQHLTYCIRQEVGHCSISYTGAAPDTPASFSFGTAAASRRRINACTPRNVQIKTGVLFAGTALTFNTDRYCGTKLSSTNNNPTGGAVRGTVNPFTVNFFSSASGNPGLTVTGFRMNYAQVPCGSLAISNVTPG